MISKKTKIINPQGFHMRPANEFASKMAKYRGDIILRAGGREINGKSLMNIMAAGIRAQTEIEVVCDGEDEQEMLDAAISLISSGFGEAD